MFRSPRTLIALLSVAALAACNDSDVNAVHTTNFAVVRLVNATDTPITVVGNSVVDTVNTGIPFGSQSSCLIVDLTTVSPVVFTVAGTGEVIAFTSTLALGANVTVVAYAGADGRPILTTLSNVFTPAPGQAGLRLFNAAAGSGTLFASANGTPIITTGTSFGAASAFVSVSSAPMDITIANGTSIVLDAGLQAFPAGQNSTMVVGPPATGTVPLRFFTSTGC
ncbi:MAG: hypothetical protein ACREPM_12450 [Gemmatimonadaceae bacterium]